MIKIPVRIELNIEAASTDQLWLRYNRLHPYKLPDISSVV